MPDLLGCLDGRDSARVGQKKSPMRFATYSRRLRCARQGSCGAQAHSHAVTLFTGGTARETVWMIGRGRTNESPMRKMHRAFTNTAGSDLLSHTVSHAVPSAVSGLTSVFGMGTGVTLIL